MRRMMAERESRSSLWSSFNRFIVASSIAIVTRIEAVIVKYFLRITFHVNKNGINSVYSGVRSHAENPG